MKINVDFATFVTLTITVPDGTIVREGDTLSLAEEIKSKAWLEFINWNNDLPKEWEIVDWCLQDD
jgi:hypothetical protein